MDPAWSVLETKPHMLHPPSPSSSRSPSRARDVARPDLSVVVAFQDSEDSIGHRVHSLAAHLRSLRASFELLAVNDGSHDNSAALLSLIQSDVPELRVLHADVSGRAFLRGAAEARGAVVVLMDAEQPAPLGPLGWALGRLAAGREAVILRGRYIVARRLLALPVIVRAAGRGAAFERSFERRAGELGIDVVGTRPRRAPSLLDPVLRFLAA